MRLSHAIAATAIAVAALTSCQTDAVMWGDCAPAANGNSTGTDGTYVLNCEDGTWVPLMSNDEFVRQEQGKSVTIAALPTKPTTTTTIPALPLTVTSAGRTRRATGISRRKPDHRDRDRSYAPG